MVLVSFFEIFASIRVLKISKSPLSRCRACPCITLPVLNELKHNTNQKLKSFFNATIDNRGPKNVN